MKSFSPPKTGRFATLPKLFRAKGNAAPAVCGVLALLLALAIAPSAASAKQTRLFAGTLGSATSTVPDPYPLSPAPSIRVAADESSHTVYVADPHNNRVEKFDSSGHFLFMFGAEVNKTAVEESGTRASEEGICPAPGHEDDECQPGASSPAVGGFESLEGLEIAVDNSPGGEGDVYVGESGEGRNEEQTIYVPFAAGGSFKLGFKGQETTSIAVSTAESKPTAATIQSALEGLSTIGAKNIAVLKTNETTQGLFFNVEFKGALSGTDVPLIGADSSLQPPTEPVEILAGANGRPGAFPNVTKFDSEGRVISGWGNDGKGHETNGPPDGRLNGANATGEAAGPFTGYIGGLAVDPTGNLWVDALSSVVHVREFGHEIEVEKIEDLFEFKPDGGFEAGFSTFGGFAGKVGSAGRAGIAVDPADHLYIGPRANEQSPSGTLTGPIIDGITEAESLAVDPAAGDLYAGVITPNGGAGEQPRIQRYDSSCHPTVTTAGEENGTIGPGCTPAESFGADLIGKKAEVTGLAIDSSTTASTLYAAEIGPITPPQVLVFSRETVPGPITAKPSSLTATTATLNGFVEPEGVPTTHCYFEWGTTTAYGNKVPCAQGEVLTGSGKYPVSADIAGLSPGITYHFRLVASNAATDFAEEPSLGEDLAFGPPLIEGASAIAVAAIGAELQAEVDPQNVDTHLRLEYVTQQQFEATEFSEALITPETDIGSAGSAQSITLHLSGLVPGTTYRYRLHAESALAQGPEAVIGPPGPLAFTTQPAGSPTLPDHRAWELVSPPDKHGARLLSLSGTIQAAAAGDAITFEATAPTGAEPQGNSNRTQVLAARGTGGWTSLDINAPHVNLTGVSVGSEYRFFSEDLSSTVLGSQGAFVPSLSSAASESTPFLRTNFPASEPSSLCTASCFQPLLTGCPSEESGEPCPPAVEAAADVPPGTEFGEDEECIQHVKEGRAAQKALCGPNFLGASPDASHAVLESATPLVEGAPGGGNSGYGSLYEWSAVEPSAEQLQFLSILPGGAGPASPGSAPSLGSGQGGGLRIANAISTDGSRVVWSEHFGNHHLYLRYNASRPQSEVEAGRCTEAEMACTIQLDLNHGGSGAGEAKPVFQTASADGSRIFFTDTQRLTSDSGAEGPTSATLGQGKDDLYECDVTEGEAGQLSCQLTDLTPIDADEEPADVRRAILGASADGSYVYFVANGVLATGAARGDCESGNDRSAYTCNLYLLHEGQTTFIASLNGEDSAAWSENSGNHPSRVSPNGRWLAFISRHPLTGYDNRDAVSGRPDDEVFLYHAAATAGGESTLVCASCDPTGARPHGVEFNETVRGESIADAGAFPLQPGSWFAALVPGWNENKLHQPRYLSNGGRLFFDSLDSLVPADSNGTGDVYAYEPPQGPEAPPGDTCTVAAPTYSTRSAGCIDLISSGTSGEESAFLDASESGEDVFFLTAAQLSRRDADTSLDLYDARVGGGEPEPPQAVECEGDGCQQPIAPPNDQTPGSLTFHGQGNIHEEAEHHKTKKKHKRSKHHERKRHGKSGKRASSMGGGHR